MNGEELKQEISDAYYNDDMCSRYYLVDAVEDIVDENAKLRELAVGMYGMLEMVDKMLGNHDACETPRPLIFGEDKSFKDVMRELGVIE